AARGRAVRAGLVLVVAGLVVAVVYAPYAVARDEMALARDPAQTILHSVVPVELGRALASVPHSLRAKGAEGQRAGGTPGVVAAVLLAVGVVGGGRTARLYALLALAALLLSFGPVVLLPWGDARWVRGPYGLFYDYLPGFTALREPRRFTGFVVGCGA